MSDGRNGHVLIGEILARSVSQNICEAFKEWEVIDIYLLDEDEDAETCLCSHYPIMEICVIQNQKNGKIEHIGNVCVKKFMETDSDILFRNLRKLRADVTKSMGVAMLDYALSHKFIEHWEYVFYRKRSRKRKLSLVAEGLKLKINKKVLKHMEVAAQRYKEERAREKERERS